MLLPLEHAIPCSLCFAALHSMFWHHVLHGCTNPECLGLLRCMAVVALWCQVKDDIIEVRIKHPGTLTAREYWRKVEASDTKRASLSRVLQLARIMFIVAVNTAVVERGFSLHKHIKAPKRSRLHTATIDSLMRIALLHGSNAMVLGANYKQSTLLADAASALPYYEAKDSLVKRLHHQLSNMEVSDEVLEADSPAVEELAELLLADDLSAAGEGDSEGSESEGSELMADDEEVEMALEAAWQATLQVVGLAAAAADDEGAELEGVGEGADAGAADAADESDSDGLAGLGLD
jgi:hypothetical protein